MLSGAFSPTHTVPPQGTRTWPAPDPGLPADGRLDPGLPVQVVSKAGAWAQVRCSNDWVRWVDGRTLMPLSAEPPVPVAAPLLASTPGTVPTAGPVPDAEPVSSPQAPAGVRVGRADRVAVWLPVVGAALVVVGAVLPWFSVVDSVNAFDLSVTRLLDKASTASGPDMGWFLLPVVVVVVGPILGTGLPRPLLALLGAVPIVLVLLFLRLYASFPSPRPDLGAGLFLTLVGGGCIAVAAALPRPGSRTKDPTQS
ncbi:MAG: hypothetical protein JNK12_04980 [Acidimicrobiales bacterium]|nr:hypothetical protein [Acidimicrobiales bacterium]